MTNVGFIIIASALILTGLLIINGSYWNIYFMMANEYEESGKCYVFHTDPPPREVDCTSRTLERVFLFGIIVVFIAGGVVALIKGLKGH